MSTGRPGFFKTSTSTEDGRDQVTGFQMAGEMLGLDGLSADRHACDAVALEDSTVCTGRGFPMHEMVLRMTREEIGSYLGLKLETVSRAFSRFHEDGVLEVRQRQIRIVDQAALQRLAVDARG